MGMTDWLTWRSIPKDVIERASKNRCWIYHKKWKVKKYLF